MILKVTNTKSITQHAYDTIRYLKANDPRAEKSYQKFLIAGEKAPGYARLKFIEALNAPENQNIKPLDLPKSKRRGTENWSMSSKLNELTQKFPFETLLFNSSYRELYPETIYKRKAIESYFENFCVDTSKLKTSRMKWYKKLLAYWNKISD